MTGAPHQPTLVRSTQWPTVHGIMSCMAAAKSLPCPCCGHRTLPELGQYDLCPVCFWEDDPNQSMHPNSASGANGKSLIDSQGAYAAIGAMDQSFVKKVRAARPTEARDEDWRLIQSKSSA